MESQAVMIEVSIHQVIFGAPKKCHRLNKNWARAGAKLAAKAVKRGSKPAVKVQM
jgi:hypothetical protein